MRLGLLRLGGWFSTAAPKYEYLYGVNPIEIALAAGRRKIEVLILSDSESVRSSYRATRVINKAQQLKIPIVFNTKEKMNSLVNHQPHQNMIIKCTTLEARPAQQSGDYEQGIYVLCDKITDPQNFGAILRTSMFYGVRSIFVPKKSAAPLNPTVSKTSSGALELMQVHTVQKQEQFLKQWRQQSGLVISTSVSNQTQPLTPLQCRNLILDKPDKYRRILLILGSEGYGVSPHLSRNSDVSVSIERVGEKEYPFDLVDSLNVNSALSSILYELTLQK